MGEPKDMVLREINQSQKGKYCMSHLCGASETAERREAESGWAEPGVGAARDKKPSTQDTCDAR